MANFSNYFIANASCRGYLVDKMNDLLLMLKLELVSKELNHLGTILHVFAGVWFLWSKKICFFVIIFQKEKGNTFTLLIFLKWKVFKKSKIAQIYYYDPQSAGINMQSPQSDLIPWTLTLVQIRQFRNLVYKIRV